MTVCAGTSLRCWYTMPMPCSMASSGDLKVTAFAGQVDFTFVRLVLPEQDLHQGRFTGTILAQDGVDFSRLDLKINVVIGDDTPGKRFVIPRASKTISPRLMFSKSTVIVQSETLLWQIWFAPLACCAGQRKTILHVGLVRA